ncbi:hypothetical protein [Ruegeria sp. YS9]|uniref:hypothetical protein n=1 Tax=Ruegeria sp. YS9 TaxID=2966453 RepID=UPI0027D7E4A5|nr:hypothetical protein [Ruegeria sp. YS9]
MKIVELHIHSHDLPVKNEPDTKASAKVRALDTTLVKTVAYNGATVRLDLVEGVWLAAPYIEGNCDPENGTRIKGGHIAPPTGPGLGVVPDESLLGTPVAWFQQWVTS